MVDNLIDNIFIDEPFEKMSDHNIKLMLDFFKNQNFQVIFCAPPNKLESIGSECGSVYGICVPAPELYPTCFDSLPSFTSSLLIIISYKISVRC